MSLNEYKIIQSVTKFQEKYYYLHPELVVNEKFQIYNNYFENISKKKKPLFSIHFDGFPYLGIWTKPNAPFLCIEPWCGLADNVLHNGVIDEKEGINFLESNEVFTKNITVVLM